MASPSHLETGHSFEPGRPRSRLRPPLTPAEIAAARRAAEELFIQDLGIELDPRIPAKIAAARILDPKIPIPKALKRHDIFPDALEDLDAVSEV